LVERGDEVDFDKEIIERLTRIEERQSEIASKLTDMSKQFSRLNAVIVDHEKRLTIVEQSLENHIRESNKHDKIITWRYGLIIPVLVSGGVMLVDVIMRFAGY